MLNFSGLFSNLLSGIRSIGSLIGQALSSPWTFAALGLLALSIIYYQLADSYQLALWWMFLTLCVVVPLLLIFWLVQRRKKRQANAQLGEMLESQIQNGKLGSTDDLQNIREHLLQAIRTIKTSKIGQVSGNAALYELPWYMIIGNPAAGKSSVITNSGLQFPLSDSAQTAIRGVGGTRNCDWFFTTEGILLDTAGRYSVQDENRQEWMGFLELLKRYRSKAPINGIIVAASISELTAADPEFAIKLAKNLRQRVQEITEKLEVIAPIYIIFTKADLIAGFTEFFADTDTSQRNQVWGTTLPYQNHEKQEVIALFDQHFDVLLNGVKEISLAQIAISPKNALPPGLLTFPLEFAAIKPALRIFLATFFEENPYQYNPVFRGFYFTSAVQEGQALSHSTPRLKAYFGLKDKSSAHTASVHKPQQGYFLKNLFSKVIFADKSLVRQYANPQKNRYRYAAFISMVLCFGLMLGAWSWSYLGNQQLIRNIQADFESIVQLQVNRTDLESRLDAMSILQDRIEQLERFEHERPWSLRFGLYQGEQLKERLLSEYYNGLQQFMLDPVKGSLEDFLSKVSLRTEEQVPGLQQASLNTTIDSEILFQDAAPDNVEDAYNALKTYLMMSSTQHVEPSHLADQVTRFWRNWLETNRGAMPRDKLIHSASRMVSFYTGRSNDALWPEITQNLALVEQTRGKLRSVMQGMPARERAYATIKARATTRYQPMTVTRIVGDADAAILTGSYAIPGTFTHQAWFEYIEPAFLEASRKELQTTDWVLGTSSRDDLTLDGSPEQIFKNLSTMYKTEYAQEWSRFLRGIAIKPFISFTQAVQAMDKLGNPELSPLRKLIMVAYEQTAWDNPASHTDNIGQQADGPGWFKRVILRQGIPSATPAIAQTTIGPIGEQFQDIARMVTLYEGQSMLGNYLASLSSIRTRFNLIQNEGDSGPGTLKLLEETLAGKESPLSDALKLVDEQILAGLTDTQRQTLRPLLVRPLIQSYAAILPSAEAELNKIWRAQAYKPFNEKLAAKYPFNPQGSIEASSIEIASIFGPEGAISHFVTNTLSPLTIRRGSILTSRTWGDQGINLRAEFTANFAHWIAPLSGGAASNNQQVQTHFQIQPRPASGVSEYTIEIDGQQLRYRNTPAQWVNFIWPNPQGVPGVKISAVALDGTTIHLLNEPGRYGLERMLASAERTVNADGSFNMLWKNDQYAIQVPIVLRIISNTQASNNDDAATGQGFNNLQLPMQIVGGTSKGPAASTSIGVQP